MLTVNKTQLTTLPPKIAALLKGAAISWSDKTPLSEIADEMLHFCFNTNTCATTDLLLRRNGLHDISMLVNIKLHWKVTISIEFKTPNKGAGVYRQEKNTFTMHSPIFPFNEKLKRERDQFYMQCQLENQQIPPNKKAWGIYNTTHYSAVCLGA